MSKGLGLLSGGLDSSLAALTLKRQGVSVTCLAFVTPFFGAAKARKAAALLELPLLERNISEVHLELVKNPVFGYGKNLNPCIDCHALMFRLAGVIMEEEGFDFLFSGEVLGQRPMSQNLNALKTVAMHSGFPERILRPLSAKLLPTTPMEEAGLVDREGLLDIQGRTRGRQKDFARRWGLVDYPSSGGGCLLTEKSFSGRLRDLFAYCPEATTVDVELLKLGRQFRLSDRAKLTLGRNLETNQTIQAIARPDDTLLQAIDFDGPTGLVSGDPSEPDLQRAAAIVAAYGKGQGASAINLRCRRKNEERYMMVLPLSRDECQPFQIE